MTDNSTRHLATTEKRVLEILERNGIKESNSRAENIAAIEALQCRREYERKRRQGSQRRTGGN